MCIWTVLEENPADVARAKSAWTLIQGGHLGWLRVRSNRENTRAYHISRQPSKRLLVQEKYVPLRALQGNLTGLLRFKCIVAQRNQFGYFMFVFVIWQGFFVAFFYEFEQVVR